MGSAKYALGDFDGAKRALKAALKLKPDYADAHCDLGCTYCALGQVDSAKQCFKNAVKCKPKHLEAHFNMGNLYRQCAEMGHAIQSYNQVLSADPGHWRSLLNKAVVQTCTGEREDAAFNLKLALKLSGQGGILQQEIDQLKKMLKQGAGWEVISQMMSYISDKAAQVETLGADAASTPQSKPVSMFGRGLLASGLGGSSKSHILKGAASSKASRSKLTRMGQDLRALVAAVDVPMLQQLAPLTLATPAEFQAQAKDENVARLKKGKLLKLTRAEALLRRVLHATPPGLFQHMMRTLNSQVLVLLDRGRSGYLDLPLLLMVLVSLSSGPVHERLTAAYAILAWKKGGDSVTQRDACDYIAALRVVFSSNHDPAQYEVTYPAGADGHLVNQARFANLVTDAVGGFGPYEALPVLCQPLN